jgi:osmotically-inducible protein OsmY
MRALSLFLVLGLLFPALTPAFAQKAASDDKIHDDVIRHLAADRDVKGGGIDVQVVDGVVTLRGKLREAKQISKAERVAKKVKGVKKVVNELRPELGSEPTPAPAGQ